VDLDGALFLFPTIFEPLPATRRARPWERDATRIGEDDWRQIEVVANTLEGEVRDELSAINAVRATAKGRPGFERVHVRERPVLPLAGRELSVSALQSAFEASKSALGFRDRPAVVAGGFALRTADGALLYGVEHRDAIVALGVEPGRGLADRDCATLADLLAEADAMVVHWCRGAFSTGPVEPLGQLLA
jgi:hypothetical protein